MNTTVLRPSIWLINLILLSIAASIIFLLSLYYYRAYSINDVFLIEYLDAGIKAYSQPWMANLKILLWIISFSSSFYLFYLIRKVITTIKSIGPFDKQVVLHLKQVSTWFIITISLYVIANFTVDLLDGQLRVVLNLQSLITLFLISIVFVMIKVFSYGAYLQAEQKLTI